MVNYQFSEYYFQRSKKCGSTTHVTRLKFVPNMADPMNHSVPAHSTHRQSDSVKLWNRPRPRVYVANLFHEVYWDSILPLTFDLQVLRRNSCFPSEMIPIYIEYRAPFHITHKIELPPPSPEHISTYHAYLQKIAERDERRSVTSPLNLRKFEGHLHWWLIHITLIHISLP